MRGVIVGSFDPFTAGHAFLVHKALTMFDNVRILVNRDSPNKKYMASTADRIEIIERIFKDNPHVTVEAFSGLLVDKLEEHDCLVRGIRNVCDYIYEEQLLNGYRELSPTKNVNAIYIIADNSWKVISSSLIRELIHCGSPQWRDFTCPETHDLIQKCYAERISIRLL